MRLFVKYMMTSKTLYRFNHELKITVPQIITEIFNNKISCLKKKN